MAGEAGGRWRLRNWRLRTKLLAVLLIPTVAVITLVGLRVRLDLAEANRLSEAAVRVRVEVVLAEVTHRVQRERDLTVRFVADDRKGGTEELKAQRDRVNQAIGEFERQFAGSADQLDPQVAAGFRQVREQLGGLTGLRFAGEFSNFPADSVLRSYSDLVDEMLTVGDQPGAPTSDTELARIRLASNALARIKDTLSIRRAVLAEALAQGAINGERTRALLGAQAQFEAARKDFHQFATPDQRRMYDDTVLGIVVDQGNDLVEAALRRAEGDQVLSGLDPVQWDTAATYTINLVREVENALQVTAQTRTDSLAAAARAAAIRDSAIVLGVVLFGGVLAIIVTRSLMRSLRILRRSALEVAEHRLPAAVEDILADPDPPYPHAAIARIAPVPVFSKEELGQVARAFDAVHGEAVRLAGEQARLRETVNSMFVNLSRRSQELVERQLAVLDRMEAEEQDPEILGGLFELDHLATRMRRNSENLLVLSGNDPAREVAGPVNADEVVGAALSEVEHYQRIELLAAPEITVRAEAVSDLVHVISELLENATAYSPSNTMVSVESTVHPDGSWQIDIVDRGTGMAEAEIKRTNARLESPPKVDVEVSRRMGLYVVGRLSLRHHITVRLANRPGTGGLTATVVVPPELVAPAEPVSLLPEPPITSLPLLLGGDPALPGEIVVPEPDSWNVPESMRDTESEPVWPVLEEPLPEPLPEPEPVLAGEPPGWPDNDPEPSAPFPAREPVEDSPGWPTEDDVQLDGPTERMPAYADVLTRWFRVDDGAAEESRPRHTRSAHAEQAVLTLSPDAVRGRMRSLQHGRERGRYVRDRVREREYGE